MADSDSLREQLRRNSVALISLVVALSSLGYNTWRNERTEANRNVRHAGFQLMSELAELQQVVFLAHYDRDAARGNPRVGWTHVLAVRDLAYPMPDAVRAAADNLHAVWTDEWAALGESSSYERIDGAIDGAKREILTAIQRLD